MWRRLLPYLLLLSTLLLMPLALSQAAQSQLNVHLFWQQGCPYCDSAKADLRSLVEAMPGVQLRSHELGTDEKTERVYEMALSRFGYQQAAVPLVIIGERSFLGHFEGGQSAKQYEEAMRKCLETACRDVVAEITADTSQDRPGKPQDANARPEHVLPKTLEVPFVGPVQLADLSLFGLTVLLAAIDGFNPCAMWVLVFLIGLLLGLENERRMWILGAAFLGATGVMYFAVMVAWLNIILFIGAIVWVRVIISLLAIGGGLYFLREYWTKPEAVCHVTNPGRRQRIMSAFRATVEHNQLVLSVAGIMALAVLVNFIELLCSAGIPAVYTQVLAMNELPIALSYFYVGVYVTVFMLDDIAIFATAMVALRVTGLTGSYARYSHLIGGLVLLMIGAVMLLRPELLSIT